MITITKTGSAFIFHVNGMHKMWTLKSQLTIPIENIAHAHQTLESIRGWHGWRMPGTYIPSIITAGTFYKEGKKIFWDVTNVDQCIIVELKDEDYNQLVIEVENPVEAMALLNNTL